MNKVLKPEEKSMEKIVALCKGRGFIFPGSEIYGGLANTWDYGPLCIYVWTLRFSCIKRCVCGA